MNKTNFSMLGIFLIAGFFIQLYFAPIVRAGGETVPAIAPETESSAPYVEPSPAPSKDSNPLTDKDPSIIPDVPPPVLASDDDSAAPEEKLTEVESPETEEASDIIPQNGGGK